MRLGGVISRDLSICGHGVCSHWSGLLCVQQVEGMRYEGKLFHSG